MSKELSENYSHILYSLKTKIREARIRTITIVNNALLTVYWEIGNTINLQEKQEGWGTKVIERLSTDLRLEFPDMKGLSSRNLRYMKDFASSYLNFVMLQQPVAKIQSTENELFIILQRSVAKLTWGHNCSLLDRVKTIEERLFYTQKSIENGWSRDILVNQIESGLYNRQGAVINNFKKTLSTYDSEIAAQLFKDPYNFDFLQLGEEVKERDLEAALISHITKFMLEMGDGFTFAGRQKKITAGNSDFFIDLLLYHIKSKRYVVVELKIGEFKPEYISKMNMYLGLVDDTLRVEGDSPSIGLILCKTKDKVIAEYALRDTKKPIGIAEYKYTDMLPDNIKGELPTIEELEKELEEEVVRLQKPIDKKISDLKGIIANLKSEKIQEKCNSEIIKKIFSNAVIEVKRSLDIRLTDVSSYFDENRVVIWVNSQGFRDEKDSQDFLDNNYKYDCRKFWLEIRLEGFKELGTETFTIWKNIYIHLYDYYYTISYDNHGQNVIHKKLYHQLLTEEEIDEISDKMLEEIIEEIKEKIDNYKK